MNLVLMLRTLQWAWTLLSLPLLTSSIFLLVNDRLTERWLIKEKLNGYLLRTSALDAWRHTLGVLLFGAFLLVGVFALRQAIPHPSLTGVVISSLIVFAEVMVGARDILDAAATLRLLNIRRSPSE